jgi:XTP/dITP diphosphohydrolase
VDRLRALLASRNPNKARELGQLLPGWEIELLDADEFPPETGETYYDNARAKALFGRETGPAEASMLGEDSGLEVQGLGGRPGVHSSRSAAGDEVGWLLRELNGVTGEGRRARYVCELVCVASDAREFRGSGTLEGRISDEPRGEQGFGYDPVFIPDGEELTVAQLGNDWKAENSHRARAAQALLSALSGKSG